MLILPSFKNSLPEEQFQENYLPVVVLEQRTAKNCKYVYNARAYPSFCSLNLLFDKVLFAVVV